MGEKKLDYHPVIEAVWKRRDAFLELNPAGQVPVLIDEDGHGIMDSNAICEYLDQVYDTPKLLGANPKISAEIRRLVAWFDQKFNEEVTRKLVFEKTLKRHFGQGGPDSKVLRQGNLNIAEHLDYASWLLDRRHWLGEDAFSFADIAAAAHLSAIDFLGHVPWDKYPTVKEWYSRIKSRPSTRPLLRDHIPGLTAPEHYTDLDF